MRLDSSDHPCDDGVVPSQYTVVTRSGVEVVDAEVIHERLVTIFVNGQELATIMCSPCLQDALALGFLANEGVIESLDDVRAVHICPSGACVDVWLRSANFDPPRRMILTSGCGGGVTFNDLSQTFEPLHSDLRVTSDQLWHLMDELNQSATLYQRAGGVHTANLSTTDHHLLVAEDVGRHNTVDKLCGLALQQGIKTRDHLMLTSGRISSEMITKARRMQIPIVASHTSPTSLSVELAKEWNITLIGYLRRNSMNIYTQPERVLLDSVVTTSANGRAIEGISDVG